MCDTYRGKINPMYTLPVDFRTGAHAVQCRESFQQMAVG